MGPDITVYSGIWAHVSTKTAGALLSDVIHKVNSVQNEGHEPRGYNVNPFSGLGLKPRTHFLEYRAKALPFRL